MTKLFLPIITLAREVQITGPCGGNIHTLANSGTNLFAGINKGDRSILLINYVVILYQSTDIKAHGFIRGMSH